MLAVKSTTVKNDFKNICNMVVNGETVIVSRPKDENVVILSAKEYANLEKAKRNAEYLAKLDRGIAQKEAGTMQEHELIEA